MKKIKKLKKIKERHLTNINDFLLIVLQTYQYTYTGTVYKNIYHSFREREREFHLFKRSLKTYVLP